jgi:aminopeptidase N
LVTTENWANLTVNESFADYSEYLWDEYKYGKDAADYGLMNSLKSYQSNPSYASRDLVRFDYASRDDVFDPVSYNKGGAILHMLRNYLGDDAFFAGLTDYLKTHEYSTAEAHQLRLSLEKISGKDLNWFFNQWYYGSGNPKINYSYSYEPVKKQVNVTVTQVQSQNFQFPLAIDVFIDGKPVRHNVWADAKMTNNFTFAAEKSPDLVNINADGVLLAEIAETKTPEQYLIQFQNSKGFLARYTALEGVKGKISANAAAQKLIAAALKDPVFRMRIEALRALDLSDAAQAKLFASEAEKLAANDEKTLVKGAALAALAKTKNSKYLPLFQKGIGEVSNSVKANALAGLMRLSPEEVKSVLETTDLEGVSEDVMTEMLPLIVKEKIVKQMPNIASIVAFYPFIAFQKPELAKPAEDGFNWIMETDSPKATATITKILNQIKGELANSPQAKMMIANMLQKGLAKKLEAYRAAPQSESLKQQVELLNKTAEGYK